VNNFIKISEEIDPGNELVPENMWCVKYENDAYTLTLDFHGIKKEDVRVEDVLYSANPRASGYVKINGGGGSIRPSISTMWLPPAIDERNADRVIAQIQNAKSAFALIREAIFAELPHIRAQHEELFQKEEIEFEAAKQRYLEMFKKAEEGT